MPDAENGHNPNNKVKTPSWDWRTGFINYVKRKVHERRAKKQNETPVDRAARHTANATIALAVFTIVLAGTSVGTVWILKNQLIEMHEGGIDTHALADASKKQAKAAKDFSVSADSINSEISDAESDLYTMAGNSAGAIRATEGAMRLEQRAWVAAVNIAGVPVVGQPFITQVTAINSGRTFAKQFTMTSNVQIGPAGMTPQFDQDTAKTYKSLSLLAPNGTYIAKNTITGEGSLPLLPNPTQTDLDNFKSGAREILIFGRMDYVDIFKNPHWSTFCFKLSGEIAWNACDGHNDADTTAAFNVMRREADRQNHVARSADKGKPIHPVLSEASKVATETPQVGEPNTEHPPDNTKPSESYWHKAAKPDILPVWIGGIAALLASIAGLLTLKNLKEQARVGLIAAKAGEEGAKAALLSAQSVINAERAWLVIGIEQTNNTDTGASPTFAFTCLNQGKTPAIVKGIFTNYQTISDPFDLPVPMRDEDLKPLVLPDRTFIVSRDSVKIHPEVNPEAILFEKQKRVAVGFAGEFLVFYGRVEYHDVFGSWGPGRKPHQTRWCYFYRSDTGTLLSTGPDEYNSHT
jgi:hypothetical protein